MPVLLNGRKKAINIRLTGGPPGEGGKREGRRAENQRKQACKPNSVPAETGGDHSSSPGIAVGIKRPTRELAGAFLPGNRPEDALRDGPSLLSYLVLLRVGFTLPPASLPARCALTLSRKCGRTFSPLPCFPPRPKPRQTNKAVYFLWHFPYQRRTAPVSRSIRPQPSLLASIPPCGVRTFLSFASMSRRSGLGSKAAIARLAHAKHIITVGAGKRIAYSTGSQPAILIYRVTRPPGSGALGVRTDT